MRKELTLAAMALLLLAQESSFAQTITWTCDFKGTYTEDKEKNPFTWKVKWVESATAEDKITGTMDEGGEKSSTTGTCGEKTCRIDETYTDGPEKGKKYFWLGNYTDTETNDENVYMTSFKGTWGSSPTDRKSGGTWEAKANCKK